MIARKNAETTKEAPADFIMLKMKITKETAAAKKNKIPMKPIIT